MNFEVNRIRADEVEINVKNIIRECLAKKHIIGVVALLFAVLLPVLIYAVDLRGYEDAQNSQTNVNIELSENDIIAINTYELLAKRADDMSKYEENSILLGISYDNVYCGSVVYHINAQEDIKSDIVQAVKRYVEEGTLAEELSTLEGFPEARYIQELFDMQVIKADTIQESGIVGVSVVASNQEECAKYITETKNLISSYAKVLNGTIGVFDMTIVQEVYDVKVIDELYTKQKTFFADWKAVKNELANHTATLTITQKASIGEPFVEELQANLVKPGFSFVYAIVGAMLGVVLTVVFVFMKVVFGGKLQAEDELEKRLGIINYGSMSINKADNEKQISMILNRILLSLDMENKKDIYFVGTMNEEYHKELESLLSSLGMEGVSCNFIENALGNPNELARIENKENVVMVESIGKSKLNDIYAMASLLKTTKIDVLGYITFCE